MSDIAIDAVLDGTLLWHLRWCAQHSPLSRFILEHGSAFTPDADTLAGPRDTPGQCYMNATHLAQRNHHLRYVEGQVLCHGVPIDHAWCVDVNTGRIIDTTLRADSTAHAARITEYFGVPFETDYLRRTTIRAGYYGLFSYTNKSLRLLLEGRRGHTKFKAIIKQQE
jgi:hypothetical protein